MATATLRLPRSASTTESAIVPQYDDAPSVDIEQLRSMLTQQGVPLSEYGDQDLISGLVMMEADGAWHAPRLSPVELRYIENEAAQRGISITEMYEQFRRDQARVDSLMPRLEDLDDCAVPIPDAWRDNATWDHYG
jgi:hypothetical protein